MSSHAGPSGTPLPRKIGAKPGDRALVVGAPEEAPALFEDGVRVLRRAGGAPLDVVVVFTTARADLARRLPGLRRGAAGRDDLGRLAQARLARPHRDDGGRRARGRAPPGPGRHEGCRDRRHVVRAAPRDPQGASLSPAAVEPIFRRAGERFVPTGHARGPWDPDALHGGAPAALVAEAVAAAEPADGMAVVRLTCEFLGPVPLAPLAVTAEVVRAGRRQQLLEAEVRAGDRTVVRARAVRLRRGDVDLPAALRRAEPPPGGPPEEAEPDRNPFGQGEAFHRTGMELRFAGGTSFGRGPGLAWLRLARPLVDDEPVAPVARVAAAADFSNGVSRVLDFERHLFVNTDLSIHLHRGPAGEWVLLDARTHVEPSGAGLAESRLFDAGGRIGLAAQSLFVDRR